MALEQSSQEVLNSYVADIAGSYDPIKSVNLTPKGLSNDELLQYMRLVIDYKYEHPKHKLYKENYEEMAVHVNGTKPDKLIKTRRPKEDDERYQYRMYNYEPITKGIMREAINSLFRIFNEQNYEFRLSQELEAYIKTNRFKSLNFINWVQSHVLFQMILDPNGLVVTLPSGSGIDNPYEKVDVSVETVCSLDVKIFNDDILIYRSDEKSIVSYYNREVLDGTVYYVFTKTDFYKLVQYGKFTESNYSIKHVYTHNLGFIPATYLGGEWNSTLGIYESYFNSFVPFANEAIRQYSDWQAVMVTSAYPVRVMKRIECNYTNSDGHRCVGGHIQGGDYPECPRCNGSGFIAPSSPFGVYLRADNTPLASDDGKPPLEYISPDTAIIELSKNAWNDLLNKAKECLHLDVINEAQSGDAKTIDREREYAMIMKIANNVFDNIISRTLLTIEHYREVISPVTPQIIKPREFNLKTERDLIKDLGMLKASNSPTSVVREVIKELLKRRYIGDIRTYYYHMFLLEYCIFYLYTIDEMNNMVANGAGSKLDIARAVHAQPLLDGIVRGRNIAIEPSNFKELATILDAKILQILDDIANNTIANSPIADSRDMQSLDSFDGETILGLNAKSETANSFSFNEKVGSEMNNDYVRGLANQRD